MARAIAILCCSPPDRYTPFVPITVSMPFGSFSTISMHCAAFKASVISSRVASGFAICTFSNIDVLMRRLFWNTKDTLSIKVSFGISRISIFPINMHPFCGSKNLVTILARVVLPPPDAPTNATTCPGLIFSDTSLSAFFSPS